ncbi:MAG: DUF6360 family protein, partial [Halobaculum sp.]
MADRILKANAFTTLDLADGAVRTHDGTESAPAVVNVTAPRKSPDHVEVAIEVDNVELDAVGAHADTVSLSPEQAREVAA